MRPLVRRRKRAIDDEDDESKGQEADERLSEQTTQHDELLSLPMFQGRGSRQPACRRDPRVGLSSGSGQGVYQIGEV